MKVNNLLSKKPELSTHKKQSLSHAALTLCIACNQNENRPLYKCHNFNNMLINIRWKIINSKSVRMV